MMDCGLPSITKQPKEEGLITLLKDKKVISRVHYIDSPIKLRDLSILDIEKSIKLDLSGLPHFLLHPACYGEQEKNEWKKFTDFLTTYNRVARVVDETHLFYILPPDQGTDFIDAIVFYRKRETDMRNKSDEALLEAGCMNAKKWSPSRVAAEPPVLKSDRYLEERDCKLLSGNRSTPDLSKEGIPSEPNGVEKNYFQSHPKVLPSLSQSHSPWIFGAIAELVDNSRDAKATKFEISIQTLKIDETEIPMLLVIDDGHGMSHEEILGMLSFGREAPEEDDPMRIGRFGFGFKTGSMRIGRDAIVFTQTATSRSIGLLSQSLNAGKKVLEIPIVSYRREGPMMEFDTSVHTEATAKYNLKLIQKFSGFNKYFIGALFPNNGTGTQIYIWNLDKYGPKCCLQWTDNEKNAVPEGGDILIRPKRIRARPGQISTKVPLDYSLRSYLEVIFLDPRMKIYIQGSVVKSRPLAKSLNKTSIVRGDILGKSVELTLGRSQLEWEQMNCGIFIYWHGRLIEAYKRVGGMVHNADMGRGVIGVIDVSDLMNDGKEVWIKHTKQAFQDCEVYDKLEEWLGQKTDEYWDNNFDRIQVKKTGAGYQPDHEWVQCDKCRKWRIMGGGYKSTNLPAEWFCYMPPFNGKCENPEESVDMGVITVGSKRCGTNIRVSYEGNNSEESSNQTQEDGEHEVIRTPLKRLKKRTLS